MNRTISLLVVDDDPAIRQIYSEILRAEGYEVWEAATGQQALQVARDRRPDLVLLDVMLPDLNGVEVCRRIKAYPDLKDVFVVLVSGMATSVTHTVDGLEAGADDYLSKLLDATEFLARIRTILRLCAATAALRAGEQHYRRLVEILPEAVGLLDLQGRLLSVNPQGVAMLGYVTSSECCRRACSIWFCRRTTSASGPTSQRRWRGTLRNVHYTLLTKQEHPLPVELSATAARDTNGQTAGLVLICRDITERKHFETALTHSIQALQEHLVSGRH